MRVDDGNGRGKRHVTADTPPEPATSELTQHGYVSFRTEPGSAGTTGE